MAKLRITDAALLTTVKGNEKIPTGEIGNYAVSIDQVAAHTKEKLNLEDSTSVDNKVLDVQTDIDTHKNDLLNPHQVTSDQVGLGNVDNTSDLDKPLSNADITALSLKADKTYVDSQDNLKADKTTVEGLLLLKADKVDLVASKISSDGGQTQQEINDFGGAKWHNKAGGYDIGSTVKLENGNIVKSTVANNIVDPNIDMTGWVLVNSDSQIKIWSGRTQDQKNKDSIHVFDFRYKDGVAKTDQQTIQDAVNYCLSNNRILNWDGENLTSTGNITDFWNVQHTGQGTITRDGSVFNITPILAQVNSLYVSTTGSLSNDGLSPNTAFRQPNSAVACIENYLNSYDGKFVINLTAGTFQRIRFNKALKFDIEIVGATTSGYPSVPTTLINEGASVSASGIILKSNTLVKDIKISGYNGTSSSQGISQVNSKIETENVHVDDCYYGISAGGGGSTLSPKSGIISNCGYLMGKASGNPDQSGAGLRGIFYTKLECGVQDSGVRNLEVTGCSYGTRFQEYVTGHVDWCWFHDNGTAIRMYVNSRVNASGSKFENNQRDYWLTNGSVFNPNSDTVFIGTLNQPIVGENCSDSLISLGSNASYGFTEKYVRMFLTQTVVNTTSSTRIIDFLSLKASAFKGIISNGAYYKKLIVRVKGSCAGTTGTKAVSLRIGTSLDGALSSFIPVGTTGQYMAEFEAVFLPSDGGILMSSKLYYGTSVTVSTSKNIQSMALDIDANLNSWVANTADSITIDSIEWSMIGI